MTYVLDLAHMLDMLYCYNFYANIINMNLHNNNVIYRHHG